MHDVLDPRDFVLDEWRQLDASGFLVADLEAPIRAAVAAGDVPALLDLERRLAAAPRDPAWAYDEPSEPEAIAAAVGTPDAGTPWTGTDAELARRLRGAWLARCAGCVMGKPVESLDRATIERYLRAAGAWPQTGYVPLLDPLPDGVTELHWSAPESVLGAFDAAPRDDDTDYTVLGLHLLETYGAALTVEDVAREWLDRLPFTQTYTAERATYRNLIEGDAPALAARRRNPYREWIGALIRADAFGYAAPGEPAAAADLALADARLSHLANGIYGEQWAAALVAAAFTAPSLRAALATAATYVPPRTRLREALDLVLAIHDRGDVGWDAAVAEIDGLVGHYDWVHTINNAAGIAATLLWGEGDFTLSVARVVALGWDTDSSAATVGSVLGAMHGPEVVPDALAAPLHDTLRSAIRDYDHSRISALADRTLAVVQGRRASASASASEDVVA
ncbi:MAG TPA: ADP-ribosylglycohydrolase family protein [Baekduia sp.]